MEFIAPPISKPVSNESMNDVAQECTHPPVHCFNRGDCEIFCRIGKRARAATLRQKITHLQLRKQPTRAMYERVVLVVGRVAWL